MNFNKYQLHGDYHWREYAAGTIYAKHVSKVVYWIRPGFTLDIGAGDGLITSKLPNAVGIENDPYALAIAAEKRVMVYAGDAYKLIDHLIGVFDNVFMGDVIEHLEYPEKCLQVLRQYLTPGGFLYITTPPATVDGKVQSKYHYREYTAEQLTELVCIHGFKLHAPIEINYSRIYAAFEMI